jgi:hypothetical protein
MLVFLSKKFEYICVDYRDTFTCKYRVSHIRLISEFILYATKNTNDADHLIPFIM